MAPLTFSKMPCNRFSVWSGTFLLPVVKPETMLLRCFKRLNAIGYFFSCSFFWNQILKSSLDTNTLPLTLMQGKSFSFVNSYAVDFETESTSTSCWTENINGSSSNELITLLLICLAPISKNHLTNGTFVRLQDDYITRLYFCKGIFSFLCTVYRTNQNSNCNKPHSELKHKRPEEVLLWRLQSQLSFFCW